MQLTNLEPFKKYIQNHYKNIRSILSSTKKNTVLCAMYKFIPYITPAFRRKKSVYNELEFT